MYVEEFTRQGRTVVQESVFSFFSVYQSTVVRYFRLRYYSMYYIISILLLFPLWYYLYTKGTCDTCYEIDTQRRSSPDVETQEQLKR